MIFPVFLLVYVGGPKDNLHSTVCITARWGKHNLFTLVQQLLIL